VDRALSPATCVPVGFANRGRYTTRRLRVTIAHSDALSGSKQEEPQKKRGGSEAAHPSPVQPGRDARRKGMTAGCRSCSTPLRPSRGVMYLSPDGIQRAGCINDDVLH
jgi:hypothetical protein